MVPPGEGERPKTSIEREIDLLWNQGVKEVREDVKDVKEDVKGVKTDLKELSKSVKTDIESLASSISSARRWAFGLIIMAIPAYVAAFYQFLRK
jgi:hypothetical protein